MICLYIVKFFLTKKTIDQLIILNNFVLLIGMLVVQSIIKVNESLNGYGQKILSL